MERSSPLLPLLSLLLLLALLLSATFTPASAEDARRGWPSSAEHNFKTGGGNDREVLTALLWRLAGDCSPEMLQEAREGLQLRRNLNSIRGMLTSLTQSSLPFLWQRDGPDSQQQQQERQRRQQKQQPPFTEEEKWRVVACIPRLLDVIKDLQLPSQAAPTGGDVGWDPVHSSSSYRMKRTGVAVSVDAPNSSITRFTQGLVHLAGNAFDKIVPDESHHPTEHQNDRYQAPLAGAVAADAALHLLQVLSRYPSDERPLPPPSITKTLFVLWPRSLPPSAADPDSSEGLAHVERLAAALRQLVERFYTTTRQRMWVLQVLLQGVAMDVDLEESLLPSFMHVLGTVSGQLLTPAERTTVVLGTFPQLLAGRWSTFAKPRTALAPWKGALWKDPLAGHTRHSESQNSLLLHAPPMDAPLSQRVPCAGIGTHLGHWVRQAFAPLGEERMGEVLRFLVEDVTNLGPDLPSHAHKEAADLIKVALGTDGTRAMVQAARLAPKRSVWSYLMEEG